MKLLPLIALFAVAAVVVPPPNPVLRIEMVTVTDDSVWKPVVAEGGGVFDCSTGEFEFDSSGWGGIAMPSLVNGPILRVHCDVPAGKLAMVEYSEQLPQWNPTHVTWTNCAAVEYYDGLPPSATRYFRVRVW